MPRTKSPRHIANAVKDQGTSKRRTKEITDQAQPRGVRRATRNTAPGMGGAGGRGRGAGPHPGNRGGVHADSLNPKAAGERIPRRREGSVSGQRHEQTGSEDKRPGRHESSKRREKNIGTQQPRDLSERRSGEKRAGTGLVKGPSRQRAGTGAVGGRTRTGRDRSGKRGRARGGSRTRGRTQR